MFRICSKRRSLPGNRLANGAYAMESPRQLMRLQGLKILNLMMKVQKVVHIFG